MRNSPLLAVLILLAGATFGCWDCRKTDGGNPDPAAAADRVSGMTGEPDVLPGYSPYNYVTADPETILPFGYTSERSLTPLSLDRSDPADNDCDFEAVRIGGELWVFRADSVPNYDSPDTGGVYRWKGATIDNVKLQPRGTFDTEMASEGGHHWLMGVWYDDSTSRLFGVFHIEFNHTGTTPYDGFTRVMRKITLSYSDDMGLTWHSQGPIITSEFRMEQTKDLYEQSGPYMNNGAGDFDFFVDTRGGYFYLYWAEVTAPKAGDGSFAYSSCSTNAARCALSHKMQPGKWNKFYYGSYAEPGLGGRSSIVLPTSYGANISYNTYLGKYLAICPTVNGVFISLCDDIGTQNWSTLGLFRIDENPNKVAVKPINLEGTSQWETGRTFRLYNDVDQSKRENDRWDITLDTDETKRVPAVSMDYEYAPIPEASDPVKARRTKIVGSLDLAIVAKGSGWSFLNQERYYQQTARASETPDDSLALAFKGSDIYWRANKSNDSGKADVYIDNGFQKTVDLYSGLAPGGHHGVDQTLRYAFVKRGLDANAYHMIKIVVRGDKNEKSEAAKIKHLAFEYSRESYRASFGFSSLQGKNSWTYKCLSGASYDDMAFFAPDTIHYYNYWIDGGGQQCQIGPNYQVPGDHCDSVREWRAPHAGTVRIEGTASLSKSGGDGVRAKIIKNDSTELASKLIATGEAFVHDFTTTVETGDGIRFIVNKNGTKSDDTTTWDPIITYDDVPPRKK